MVKSINSITNDCQIFYAENVKPIINDICEAYKANADKIHAVAKGLFFGSLGIYAALSFPGMIAGILSKEFLACAVIAILTSTIVTMQLAVTAYIPKIVIYCGRHAYEGAVAFNDLARKTISCAAAT